VMVGLIIRPILAVLGFLLILVGIPVTPLPIPLGLPLIFAGTLLLMHSVPRFRRLVTDWLAANPEVHARLKSVQRRFSRKK